MPAWVLPKILCGLNRLVVPHTHREIRHSKAAVSALRGAFSFSNLVNKACLPGQPCEPSLKSSMHEAYAFYMQEAPCFLYAWGLKTFKCRKRQAFYMPEAFEFICMRPSANAKGSLGSKSYQIGLQLGISVISERRQNCVELVKCFPDSPKAFREDQRFLERGR
jgi:hypothetical protein